MGQKVSPIGFRTGITLDWRSRWYAPKSNFGEFLVEDERIRRFIDERLNREPPYAAIGQVDIERTRELLTVTLKTARPGLVIGPRGAEVDKLKDALEDLTNRRVNINIEEIHNPDLDAKLIAESIAEQLKRRANARRAIRQRAEQAMQAGAKGIKIIISVLIDGEEMRRKLPVVMGSIPLHTLEADVDYAFALSRTTYGTIGVKVWVYRGMFGEVVEERQQQSEGGPVAARRRRQRRSGGPGRSSRESSAPPRGRRPLAEAPSPAPTADQADSGQSASEQTRPEASPAGDAPASEPDGAGG